MKFEKLAIIIPTRNRANLATNAVQSALKQAGSKFKVIVSDNSTEISESDSLKLSCEKSHDRRLTYIRPSQPLSMSKHWEWAKNKVLEDSQISHVTYLTDRAVFYDDSLSDLIKILYLYPEEVVAYNGDAIEDITSPVLLRQFPWTGKLFKVDSELIIALSANSLWHPATPRMMNAIIPRSVFQNLSGKYQVVFESINPDFCLLYKILATETDYLHFDKSVLIGYGLKRSNGYNSTRGKETKDTIAFFQDIHKDNIIFNQYSPVPDFYCMANAIVNEYCYVKSFFKDTKFPHIRIPQYFKANRLGFEYIENEELKEKMLKLYESKIDEFHLTEEIIKKSTTTRQKKKSFSKYISKALMTLESKIIDVLPEVLHPLLRMNAKVTEHHSEEAAIRYANTKRIPKRKGLSDLEYLLDIKFTERKFF